MRNKIDYGIDLGTTNSAIARMENGVPAIKKSEWLKDTIPSCVSFNRKQDILVGDPAYSALRIDSARALKTFEKGKTNTYIEFKRTMGTTHKEESSYMDRSYSSEELSSEVLKKLKSLVPDDENISSVVITVPAKFLNPQTEATMQAAKLAGFKHIELLQEPVAAATAYGLDSKSKDGYWLVFDFGGGTFDAALIKSEEGILSVKDTDGDNWLGGKNLDEAIVDTLILPYLQSRYSIDFVINDTNKRELLRSAVKFYAEGAKNELSFKSKTRILTNLGDLPFEDENGEEPEIDLELTEADLNKPFSPIFQKAIDIAKGVLKRNNLTGSDLGALILVGGPTYSPILRRMLKEQITDHVDTSVDPMTVVAKGAALFASTISISEEVKEDTRDKTKLQLDVKYGATTVELDEMVVIKVLREKTTGNFPERIYADVIRFDGAWSSGKKLIGERSSIIDVLLVEGRSNSFDIKIYDEVGNKLECQPNQFNILQGISGLDGMQVLAYHIGIAKFFRAAGKDLFKSIPNLDQNKPVRNGIVGILKDNKTRSVIRPGIASDKIRIPIYQGDYGADGSNPILNNLVREVIITGEDLPALLPAGSDVEITIKIDSSQIMKFSAYFPLLNHTEELQVDVRKTEPPTEEFLRKEILEAKHTAQSIDADGVLTELEGLEEQLENEKGSSDGKLRILNGLRKELLKLDSAEKIAEWPKVEQELKDAFFELEDLIEKIKTNSDDGDLNMDKITAHIQEYKIHIEQIIRDKNTKEARNLISDIESLDFNLRNAVTGNAMDVEFLKHVDSDFNSYHWNDRNKARQLCNQGLQMATAGNTTAIRPILVQLIGLMPDNQKPKETLG